MRRTGLALVAVALVAAGCGRTHTTPPDPTLQARESCLYAAVTAYPTWPESNGPVLENLAACQHGVTPGDRVKLRNLMTAFVQTATVRAKKEN